MGTLLLAGLAGMLATLSPCVLPLLQVVLGAAAAEHRLAPLALAGGLMLGFAGLGEALGLAARRAMPAIRRRLASAGGWGRPVAGSVIGLVGLAMLTGPDRRAEAYLTAALPDGWVGLITRF
jgi:cytochrome c biogenesis protein CcdA